MDIGSITAAIGGLKAATEMAAALIDIRDATKLQSKIIELNQTIMSAQAAALNAQSEQFDLIDRIRSLEEKLNTIEDWEKTKSNFALSEIAEGRYVYTHVGADPDKDPNPYYCATCLDTKRQLTILQTVDHSVGRARSLNCSACKTAIYTIGSWHQAHGN